MGLDSFLTASKRLSPKSKKEKQIIEYLNSLNLDCTNSLYLSSYDEEQKPIKDYLNSFKLYGQVGEICEIIKHDDGYWAINTEAMYWRKANQIHSWFVENVQDGIDDCTINEVSIDKLNLLYDTIKKIGKNKTMADQLLPTSSGFFFGNTEYNSRYFHELSRTKKILKKILKPSTINHWEFSYSSSW